MFFVQLSRNVSSAGLRIISNFQWLPSKLNSTSLKWVVMPNKSFSASSDAAVKLSELKKRQGKKKRILEKVTSRQGYWNVVAYSTAQEYNLETFAIKLQGHQVLETTGLAKDLNNSDFLHATIRQDTNSNQEQEPQEVYIYREGAVVTWNVAEIDIELLLGLLAQCHSEAYPEKIVREESEVMSYTYGGVTPTKIVDDDIVLSVAENSNLDKYAVSNAIALSVKLGTWEAILSRYIDSMEDVTEDLKLGNKIKMSQAEVMRKTGELFMLRHALNLSSDLLDTPDIYWDREKLENVFQTTFNYFNINKRTRVMNEKLNHCIELVELLSSHLRDHHHVRLEWMIIILIMVEVGFEILHHIEREGNAPHINS